MIFESEHTEYYSACTEAKPARPIHSSLSALYKGAGRMLADESGATAIEYGLYVMLVSLGIVGCLPMVSMHLNLVFDTAAKGMK